MVDLVKLSGLQTQHHGMGWLLITSLCLLNCAHGAPADCPPGGTYFDKNIGPRGRRVCCSEICGYKNEIYQRECSNKCPNYERDKAKALQVEVNADAKTGRSSEREPPTNSTLYKVGLPLLLCLTVPALLTVTFEVVRRRWWPAWRPHICIRLKGPPPQHGDNQQHPGNEDQRPDNNLDRDQNQALLQNQDRDQNQVLLQNQDRDQNQVLLENQGRDQNQVAQENNARDQNPVVQENNARDQNQVVQENNARDQNQPVLQNQGEAQHVPQGAVQANPQEQAARARAVPDVQTARYEPQPGIPIKVADEEESARVHSAIAF